ncbi:MAG TPA: hypothetical protein VKR21_01975 [Solirubrobacteraceae bacterium]|nr:hypothetical protein [Solirubrobacteraceae bacterium]
MSEEEFQGDDAFLDWQRERARRVEKNEQEFRAYNERREQLEKPTLGEDELAPFVCECADAACWGAVQLSVEEFEAIHASDNHYSVLPGHVMPEFERVVERHNRYWVVAQVHPC